MNTIDKPQQILFEFGDICRRARENPVQFDEFVKNRIAYMQACEKVWEDHFRFIADTGVQIIR